MGKTAVIIGAGIGGITTAIFLERNGYKVQIFEKTSAREADADSLSAMATGLILEPRC